MTTFSDRPNSALLVIDLQNGVIASAYQREAVLGAVNALIDNARRSRIPVVWIRHEDSDLVPGTAPWQFVSELSPAAGEPIVEKRYRDAFEDTDLENVLSELRVGKLIVTGAQTDICIRSTLHGALVRGYDATLVGDAHTTEDMSSPGVPSAEGVIRHTNLYWSGQKAPGRTGGVIDSKDVDFGR